ncbi:hypothetical protein SCA6_003331 [Theobroma cacao]
MEFQISDNNELNQNPISDLETELEMTYNGQIQDPHEPQVFPEDYDSTCSTPYVSAPSSPGRAPGPGPGSINGGFFYSAPASPMHFAMTSVSSMVSSTQPSSPDNSVPLGFEFEFSARFGSSGSGQTGSMSSADELFLNGQIRPMKLSTHLERPQVLAPLLDLEHEDEENEDNVDGKVRGRDLRLRDKSLRRRTRSMSPLRNASFALNIDDQSMCLDKDLGKKADSKNDEEMYNETSASMSASSSRSSSAGRSSKRWVFLKDFLRSKSEGRSNNKFWSTISFSPAKEKKPGSTSSSVVQESKEKLSNVSIGGSENQRSHKNKPVNGIGKRRVPPSPHELHYTANRAQAEEMRKKTFLPYRQGLLGCLGFSSKGYGAMNGLARALNPVSSSAGVTQPTIYFPFSSTPCGFFLKTWAFFCAGKLVEPQLGSVGNGPTPYSKQDFNRMISKGKANALPSSIWETNVRGKALGVDNTFRKKFDREEYLQRAREREKQESEGRSKSKAKGPPVQRKPLKHRDYEVDLESRLGKTQVVTPVAPLSQQAGYYCSVCECVVKDSANYLDHINGKKHQRALGMSMRVERATLQQVQERFDQLKKRKAPGSFSEQDLDERIIKQQEEEEERKRQRRERKKEKKKEKAAEEEPEIDPDVAAMMGFGGFRSSKK